MCRIPWGPPIFECPPKEWPQLRGSAYFWGASASIEWIGANLWRRRGIRTIITSSRTFQQEEQTIPTNVIENSYRGSDQRDGGLVALLFYLYELFLVERVKGWKVVQKTLPRIIDYGRNEGILQVRE